MSHFNPTGLVIGSRAPIKINVGEFDSIDDLRTLKFLLSHLGLSSPYTDMSADTTKAKNELRATLSEYMLENFPDARTRKTARDGILLHAKNNFINLEDFDWLNNSHEACSAIFCYLMTNDIIRLLPAHTLNLNSDGTSTIKFSWPVSAIDINNTNTHAQRFFKIKKHFDSWSCSNNFEHKQNLMTSLKNIWASALKDVKDISWLNQQDTEACEWAWEYLEDYHRKEMREFRPGINLFFQLNPTNNSEKYLAIYTRLRLWKTHPSEKSSLITNMKKAWRERQRRRDQEGKKAINTYISVKTKEKLEQLGRFNRCPMNEVLTELINREHARLKTEIDIRFAP